MTRGGAGGAITAGHAAAGAGVTRLVAHDPLLRALDTHVGARPAPETTALHTRLRDLSRAA